MPEGIMPVQRVGISIGEGPAQVFDFPQISEAIDFGRQRKLAEEKDARLKQRQIDAENRAKVDNELSKLSDAKYWFSNPSESKIVEEGIKEAQNKIYDLAPRVAAGDLEAMREISMTVNEKVARAKRSQAYKDKYAAALTMMKEFPEEYSQEQKETIFKIGSGKLLVDEVEKNDPYWYYKDKINLEGLRQDFTKAYPDLVQEAVMSVRPASENFGASGVGFVEIVTEKVVGNYVSTLEDWINSSEQRQMDVTKAMVDEGYSGNDAVRVFAEQSGELLRGSISKIQRDPKFSNRKGDEGITRDDVVRATNLKQAVRNYAVLGELDGLREFVQGFDYNVEEDVIDGQRVIRFFTMSLDEDNNVKTKSNVEEIPAINEGAILNKIAEINSNIKMEAIEAESDIPQGDLQREVERLRSEGYGKSQFKDNVVPGDAIFVGGSKKKSNNETAAIGLNSYLEVLDRQYQSIAKANNNQQAYINSWSQRPQKIAQYYKESGDSKREAGSLLTNAGYYAIDKFENTQGTSQGTGMGKGDGYAKSQENKIKSEVKSSIGINTWMNMPPELQTQVYSFSFNHGNFDNVLKGLAQSIAPDDIKTNEDRRKLSRSKAIQIIKKHFNSQ